MKKNMGTLDKVIRIALAAVVVILLATRQLSGAAAIVLGILATVFVITSLVGTCPTLSAIQDRHQGQAQKLNLTFMPARQNTSKAAGPGPAAFFYPAGNMLSSSLQENRFCLARAVEVKYDRTVVRQY